MNQSSNDKKRRIGFIGAACTFAAAYAASSAPIPLYTTYSVQIGLSKSYLSMTSVVYFIGTVLALLIFARISNYLGRRPVIFAVLILTAIGCLIFANLHTAPLFMIGRLVQGLSCGLASSSVAAYIVDNAPEHPTWLGTAVTGSAPMIGLAAGSFGSGALAQYSTSSLSLIFEIIIAILALCAVLILIGNETVQKTKGAVASLKPQVRIPQNIRALLPAASAIFIGTWAIGGFYQAFSAPMAAEQLGTTNTMIAAAVFACLQAPNVIGSTFAGKLKSVTSQRVGMPAFLISIFVVIFSLGKGIVPLFLLASACAGASWGLAFTGSMKGIMSQITQEDRAGVLSTIYLISYSGAAIPNLVVGRVSGNFNLFQISIGYGILVAVACIITLITAISYKQKNIHNTNIK